MENFLTQPETVLIFRLISALVLGGLLGMERTMAKKSAGLRTYALVALGSALFVIIGEVVEKNLMVAAADPLRMASQIITGIGFLGAGLIIFQRSELRGLTTAAGLWVAAGVGMAAGFGLYFIAIVATVLTIFAFTVLWSFEVEVKEITEPSNDD